MQFYTITTDPMLLEYSLLSSQDPIMVSPQTGDPVFATLTFIVSKPKAAKDVQVKEINFSFPFGDGAYDLTKDAILESSASISTTGKEKWQIRQGIKPGILTAKPEAGGLVTISDQSLTITFKKLQINRVVGTADVTITEVATTGADDPTARKHTKHVPKFPYQFFFTGFSATTPSVKHNEQATLIWQGSSNADYLMLWGNAPPENVNGKHQWESPRLTSTTTFMLQVTAQSEGETVVHRATVTVIVENPNLVATDLRIGGTYLGYNDPPNDREFMLYNDDGSDALPGKYGGVYLGNKAATLRIKEDGELSLSSKSGTNFLIKDDCVGIRNPSPSYPLDVNGPLRACSNTSTDIVVQTTGGTNAWAQLHMQTQNQGWAMGTSQNFNGNQFYFYDSTFNQARMIIQPNGGVLTFPTGNVGIGAITPQNALDVKGGVVIGSTYAGAQKAPDNGLTVEGAVTLADNLTVQKDLTVRGSIIPPDGNGVAVAGDFHATGRVSSYKPIDVYFPDKSKWYRMAIGHDDWAWFDNSPFSDISLKENVRPISDALDKVMRLRGMTFCWSEKGLNVLIRDGLNKVSAGPVATEEQLEALKQAERQKAVEKLSGDRIGLIAQEVETVVPEAVSENEEGHKCVRYPQLVALLVEAIKEQGAQIQALSSEVSALGERLRDKLGSGT